MVLYFCALTGFAVAALQIAEYRQWHLGIWIAKPLAAAGFVGAGLAAGALGSAYGRWILAALVLSWLGDVFLIPRSSARSFRAGVLSFLLGHVAFVAAFAVRGLDPVASGVATALALGPGLLALRWLEPYVPEELRTPIRAYMAIISAMLICAAGAAASSGDGRILIGALMFYVSDLSVARNRFVVARFSNKAWGIPLYFAALLVLAWTVT